MFISSFCFAQSAEKANNVKLLEKYSTEKKPFKLQADIEGMTISQTGKVVIPSLKSASYEIKTTAIESELLEDRLGFMGTNDAVIVLQLSSASPKVYELLYVYNLMSVADCKELIEAERVVVQKELKFAGKEVSVEPEETKKAASGIDYDARFKKAQDLEKKKLYNEAIKAYTTIGSDSNDPHCFEASKRILAIQKQIAGSIPGLGDNKEYMNMYDDFMQLADDADKLYKNYGF